MLITNFASGELSKTLFGRTDIPQYYGGAARMENFDVIPTGGIKRRPGMERLLPLDDGEGRIIPFVVNRDYSFLLYLTPGKIRAFRASKDGIGEKEIILGEGLRLYEDLEHIRDMQYAQNFDAMVLCHENYAPIEVKLKDDEIKISELEISFKKTAVGDENITGKDKIPYETDDETYKTNGWLVSEGNYPAAVSFYNGRLVFAGTENNRQRVFFSAVKEEGKPYNFATHKTFLTENKEYITIFASILNSGIIKLSQAEIAVKFVKPVNKYHIDSLYYPKGAYIRRLEGDEMQIEPGIMGIYFNEGRIIGNADKPESLLGKKHIYEEAEKIEYESLYASGKYVDVYERHADFGVVKYTEEYQYLSGYPRVYHDIRFRICYGVRKIQIAVIQLERDLRVFKFKEIPISTDEEIAGKDEDEIKNLIRAALEAAVDELENGSGVSRDVYFHNYDEYDEYHWLGSGGGASLIKGKIEKWFFSTVQQREEIENIANTMYEDISKTMKYHLHTEDYSVNEATGETTGRDWWHYGTPEDYIKDIIPFIGATQNIYIPFYTREIISDLHPTPDCGFTFEIASDMNDAIRWLAANKGIIVGTESAEYIIPPDAHATNARAVLNSRYGSDKIQGTAIGDATVFFQAGKKSLVEYYIPQQDNNFRANNMAMLSMQMLNESPAREFDFISSPHIKLLVTREDGTIAALLYERSTGTFAWGRITTGPEILEDPRTPEHKARLEEIREQRPGIKQAPVEWRRVTSGKIRSAAVLPRKDDNDDAYLVVERGDGWFLERLRESGNIYLDSWRKVTRDGWAALKAEYGEKAALCRLYLDDQDERGLVHYEALEAVGEPDWDKGGDFYIGYPYTSVIRTMPVFHPKMDKNRVIAMIFRFLESYMPRMRAIDNGRPVGDDPVTGIEDKYLPYTGTHRKLNPGGWADDVQSELYADKPLPVTILTLNAEMAEGR